MKRIFKLLTCLVLVGMLAGCEKQLTDLQPIDQIPAQNAIQNMNDVVSAVNGVYGTYAGRRASHISSFISDELRLGTGGEYRNVGNIVFNWQYVSDTQDWRDDEQGGAWTNLYAVIDRANRILELMVPVPTPTPAEVALKAQLRGEMLAIRAIAHFELLRWYAPTAQYTPTALGVVLMKEFAQAPGSFKPTRNTQEEVMTQVIADLAEARTLIPTTWVNVGRITRNAVIGYQARVALHTRNFTEAIARASELITAQPVTARASYAALWTTRVLPENQSSEVIWKLNVTPANLGAAVGSLWQDVGTAAVQGSAPSKLTSLFDQTNDIRYSTFFRVVGARTLISKYGVVISSPANGENFQYDVKMLRTSEILLDRAEAYAENDNLTQANADLASLRSNRIEGYTHTAINDKNALIAAIMEERYKELCYEGKRYFDLKRRGLPITRDLADVVNVAAITNLPPTNFRYFLPIPQQELFANKNIQQNPGY